MNRKSLHYMISALLIVTSLVSRADDHATQVLHPYWGDDDLFLRYLKAFDEPVNVEILKYDGKNDPDLGEDVYIYIYVINIHDSENFELDVACPESLTHAISGIDHLPEKSRVAKIRGVASDPIAKNPKAVITRLNRIVWKLNSTRSRQGMWFYSSNPPGKRAYVIKGKSFRKEGQISGPSCKPGSSFISLDGSEKNPEDRVQPVKAEPLIPSGYENFVRDAARKNGCTKVLSIIKKSSDSGSLMYEISCETRTLLFECEFSKRPGCYLM